jgi:hypothetical protein
MAAPRHEELFCRWKARCIGKKEQWKQMILAAAGRRIDATDAASPVFPYGNMAVVRARLERLFREQEVSTVVCSAACGADLVALEAAETLGLRRRIVLPFAPDRFRETSVVDRPGEWGEIFERMISAARDTGQLVDLKLAETEESYGQVNQVILDETIGLAHSSGDRSAAALIWDGHSRGESDKTASLGASARERGLELFEVSTL